MPDSESPQILLISLDGIYIAEPKLLKHKQHLKQDCVEYEI